MLLPSRLMKMLRREFYASLLLAIAHVDFQVWGDEASGIFSVRSAYRLLQSGRPPFGPFNVQTNTKTFYKQLWGLNLPSKIKIHVWQASRNFLPTYLNLFTKLVVQNFVCPRCLQEAKTLAHFNFECPISRDVWQLVGFSRILVLS